MKTVHHSQNTAGHQSGFTLIELMVTLVIVAILTTLAYPSYRDYILRGQLVDATNGLAALRANMERYFQDNRTYNSTGTFVSPCLVAANQLIAGTFQLSCSVAPTATSYTLQALGSEATNGFAFTVDQTGVQTTTITGVAGWSSCATAWITKRGQVCPP